jgi:hypothetical protein
MGSWKLRTISPDELRTKFPKLISSAFEPASKATARYNCIAFVAGDERHWWEAGCHGGRYYWPPQLKPITSVETLSEFFTSQGFELTQNRDVEAGYEKIAIYVSLDELEFTHIARSDGHVWKSKLGKGQDIHHYSLDVLEGDEADEYGVVERVLRRLLP